MRPFRMTFPYRAFVWLFAALALVPHAEASKKKSSSSSATPALSASGLKHVGAIQELLGQESYDAALAKINTFIEEAKVPSYDAGLARVLKVQVFLARDQFKDAEQPLIEALEMDVLGPLQEKMTQVLAQVQFQVGKQNEALSTLTAYTGENSTANQELWKMQAVIALQVNKPDIALSSLQHILKTESKPKVDIYHMTTAALQSSNRFAESVAYLERLVEMEPKNETYWAQLISSYYQSGDRWAALVAMGRAQEKGFRKAPADYMAQVQLYYELELFEQTAQVITKFLEQDVLPKDATPWLLRAYCYDLLNQPERAIAALEDASAKTRFPQIDERLSVRYWSLADTEKTMAAIKRAFEKGQPERPADSWVLYTTAALTAHNLPEAEAGMEKVKAAGVSKDRIGQLERALNQLKAKKKAEAEAEAKLKK